MSGGLTFHFFPSIFWDILESIHRSCVHHLAVASVGGAVPRPFTKPVWSATSRLGSAGTQQDGQ